MNENYIYQIRKKLKERKQKKGRITDWRSTGNSRIDRSLTRIDRRYNLNHTESQQVNQFLLLTEIKNYLFNRELLPVDLQGYCNLLYQLINMQQKDKQEGSEEFLDQLFCIIQYQGNLCCSFKEEEIAAVLYTTIRTFQYRCKNYTNCNYLLILRLLRLFYSCYLLRTTSRTITNITFEVGYSSLGSLSKLFREILGVTPKQYRQLIIYGYVKHNR